MTKQMMVNFFISIVTDKLGYTTSIITVKEICSLRDSKRTDHIFSRVRIPNKIQ